MKWLNGRWCFRVLKVLFVHFVSLGSFFTKRCLYAAVGSTWSLFLYVLLKAVCKMRSQAEKWRTDIGNLSEDDSSADVRRTKCTRRTERTGTDSNSGSRHELKHGRRRGAENAATVAVSLHWYVRRGLEYKEMMHFCTLPHAAQSTTDRDNQYARSCDIRRCTNITSPHRATQDSTRQRCGDDCSSGNDVGNDGHCDNRAGNSRKTFSYVAATLLGNQRRPTAKNSAHDA